jgi:hypothetical protein
VKIANSGSLDLKDTQSWAKMGVNRNFRQLFYLDIHTTLTLSRWFNDITHSEFQSASALLDPDCSTRVSY